MNITNIIPTNAGERNEFFYNMVANTALNTTKKLFSEILEAERDEAVGVKRHEQSKKRNDY